MHRRTPPPNGKKAVIGARAALKRSGSKRAGSPQIGAAMGQVDARCDDDAGGQCTPADHRGGAERRRPTLGITGCSRLRFLDHGIEQRQLAEPLGLIHRTARELGAQPRRGARAARARRCATQLSDAAVVSWPASRSVSISSRSAASERRCRCSSSATIRRERTSLRRSAPAARRRANSVTRIDSTARLQAYHSPPRAERAEVEPQRRNVQQTGERVAEVAGTDG